MEGRSVPAPGDTADGEGTPWERRKTLGLIPAWARTVQLVLLEPGKAFRQVQVGRDADHFLFAVLTGSVFWALNQLLGRLLAGPANQLMQDYARRVGAEGNPMLARILAAQNQLSSPGWTLLLLLLSPLVVAIFLYLNAGVTHLFALLFGQAKRGFPATFAACAYAHAPLVLLLIPGCGSFIAVIWMIVLIGIGLKETHGIGAGGATATVLAPYLLLCCACGGLSILMMAAMQKALAGAP